MKRFNSTIVSINVMKMILAGDQPDYLPYIGFFHKMLNCDKYMIVDHVQYSKKSFQNRNQIRGNNGPILLTVPVFTKEKFEQPIRDVMINNQVNWQKKHFRSITLSYQNAPYYNDFKDFFENIYSKKWERLVELNEFIIRYIAKILEVNLEIEKSSNFNFNGKKTDLLVEMCKKTETEIYLSGEGGRAYVDNEKFKNNNLKNYFTNFKHPVYKQLSEPFIPLMSTIDLLLNHDLKTSKKIIKESGMIGE